MHSPQGWTEPVAGFPRKVAKASRVSKEPISVLICGAGSRGRSVYGQFILNNPDLARVVAVAEPLEARRQTLASEHNIPADAAFSSWRELTSAAPLAQVAIVATDDRDHLEPTLFFLERGYHVLLEKPMAPDLESCERIVEAAKRASGMSAVCHVLRYTPYFRRLRSMIEEGLVGRVLSIRHLEPVNFWHFAHSFVRGNWRNSADSSPFLLAKCCHDMDILQYLMDEKPVAVHSFGNLSYFRAESAPSEAARRCLECSLKNDCIYSAVEFYGRMLAEDRHWWPLDVVIRDFNAPALEQALKDGPYGRCVYYCDNDVCDHQIVNLEFESGATASLVASAFTDRPARRTEVMGAFGCLTGDGHKIEYQDFKTGQTRVVEVESEGHHLGGDESMMREFFKAVRENDPSILSTSPERSLVSHRMALLAERSRTEGTMLPL